MKKFIVPILLLCLLLFGFTAMQINAEESGSVSESPLADSDIPDDTLVTYGYLKQLREELKKEIIAELIASGGLDSGSSYQELTLNKGQIILLAQGSELIYRGGNAVVITASGSENCGITDMSASKELFSGNALEYGHIYFASAEGNEKAILITGETAYFTVRGGYEIV